MNLRKREILMLFWFGMVFGYIAGLWQQAAQKTQQFNERIDNGSESTNVQDVSVSRKLSGARDE